MPSHIRDLVAHDALNGMHSADTLPALKSEDAIECIRPDFGLDYLETRGAATAKDAPGGASLAVVARPCWDGAVTVKSREGNDAGQEQEDRVYVYRG